MEDLSNELAEIKKELMRQPSVIEFADLKKTVRDIGEKIDKTNQLLSDMVKSKRQPSEEKKWENARVVYQDPDGNYYDNPPGKDREKVELDEGEDAIVVQYVEDWPPK